MKIRENIPISELTTMRIGGNARFVFEVETEEDAFSLKNELEKYEIEKWYFLGRGANTFAKDTGFSGAIIINKIGGIEIEDLGNEVRFTVGGGVEWDDFIRETTKIGCTGVECLAGIPGTVGAAPVQNIGAYGQEAKDSITKIFAIDFETSAKIELKKDECDFSYRHSIFNSSARERYFIYKVEFVLRKGQIESELYGSLESYLNSKQIESRDPETLANAVRAVRDSKLPDPKDFASSGSFFKNIYVDESEVKSLDERGIPHHGTKVNTGWLIENVGLKGKDFYGFKISEKASLVLINESGKSYADLEKAISEISKIVEEKFGFKLEQEPNVIEG